MKSPEKTAFETILIIAVVLAIVMLPLAARACGGNGNMHQPPSFSEFDANQDGFVSEEEFDAFRAQRMAAMAEAGKPMKGAKTMPDFNDIDTNGDGKLTEAELVAAQQAHHEKMRAAHGAHGMGHGKGMKMPTFADLDLNGDGCIDAEEFAEHQASHHSSN